MEQQNPNSLIRMDQTTLDQGINYRGFEWILRVYSWIIFITGLHLNCPTYFSITDVSDVLLSKFEVHCQQWNLSTLLKLRISWPHGIHTITPWIPVLRGTQSLDLSRACSSDLNRQKIRIQTTRQLIAVQEWSIPQAAAEGQYYCHNSTLAYTSCSFGLFRCLGLTHGMSLTCS